MQFLAFALLALTPSTLALSVRMPFPQSPQSGCAAGDELACCGSEQDFNAPTITDNCFMATGGEQCGNMIAGCCHISMVGSANGACSPIIIDNNFNFEITNNFHAPAAPSGGASEGSDDDEDEYEDEDD